MKKFAIETGIMCSDHALENCNDQVLYEAVDDLKLDNALFFLCREIEYKGVKNIKLGDVFNLGGYKFTIMERQITGENLIGNRCNNSERYSPNEKITLSVEEA